MRFLVRIYLQRFNLHTTRTVRICYTLIIKNLNKNVRVPTRWGGGNCDKVLERLKVNFVQKRVYKKMKVGTLRPRSHLTSIHYIPKHYKTADIQVVL